jgi:DMSO/TMAO reductase YedYZ molybdopterin-dependent catalytic subunit
MECAGNGRAFLSPRVASQPWLLEAVGNAEWTGTPLGPILEEAGLRPEAKELIFTGADHGIQGEVEQDYQWSFTVEDASRDEVLLAYEINGQPLPPQHGFPVRLLVPDWYGMCSVKWLRSITAVAEPFDGFQLWAYQLRQTEDDAGVRVTRKEPRALMIPPGFPDFPERRRYLDAGTHEIGGRAWSGWGEISRVEVNVDGDAWADATLAPQASPLSWRAWSFRWDATPGQHDLRCRATDETGRVQPVDPPWNLHGFANNMAQHVPILVR